MSQDESEENPEKQMETRENEETLQAEKISEEEDVKKETLEAEFTEEESSPFLSEKEEEMKRIGSLLKLEEEETPSPATEIISQAQEKKEAVTEAEISRKIKWGKGNLFLSFLTKNKVILAVLLVALLLVGSWSYLGPSSESIEVFVPEKRIGDLGRYEVWGEIRTTTPNKEIKEIQLKILNTQEKQSRMTIWIKDYQQVKDGFGNKQEAYVIETSQDLKIGGTVESSSLGKVEVEGVLRVEEESYAVWDKVIKNHLTTHLDVQGKNVLGSMVWDVEAELFPSLTSSTSGKNQLEDVYREKTIKKGDGGNFEKGGVEFIWRVTKEDEVKGKKCLVVEYEFDKEKLKENLFNYNYFINFSNSATVDEAYIRVWVTNERSFEMKRRIYISGHDNETEFVLDYNAEMVSYTRGQEDIVKKSLDYPAGQLHELAKRESWDKFPEHGEMANSSIPGDYTLKVAYDEANRSNDEFANYMEGHPLDYLVYGKYNESNDIGIWNLTFSRGGATKGFLINVTRHSGTIISNDFGERSLWEIDPTLTVTKDKNELSSQMLTFSSAEQIFKNNSKVYSKAFDQNTGRLNFDKYSFGVRTNLAYPGIDITTMNFDVESSPYAYFIKREENDDKNGFIAGVDATNGQMLFVLEYTYSYTPFG